MEKNNRNIQGNRQHGEDRGGENRRILDNKRRMRQGCPLSPTLFNAFLSDLEDKVSKVGGVVIGREKVRTIVLVATTEVGMKGMLRTFST